MAKYIVTLTDEEREQLKRMIGSGKGAARKLLHARILFLADAGPEGLGRNDEAIAEALQVGLSTIHRARQRFVEDSFESALIPRCPPKRPDKLKLSGEIERQVIALACGDPPAGRCRWTLNLLARRIVELGYTAESISRETVRKTLKKRHRPVSGEDVVHSAESQRGLRMAHGGCPANVPVGVRPALSRGLHG